MPSPDSNAERRRDARLRGHVLLELKLHHPVPITDASLRTQLNDLYQESAFTERVLRQVVDYLSGHGLVEYQSQASLWGIKITSRGIDYLDGYGETLPGVQRHASVS
jgi:hypothetical protein